MRIYPFRDGDTFSTFQNHLDNIINEIRSLENEYILKASKTELADFYVDKASIQPLILHTDQYYMENQSGTKIDVSHDFDRAVFPGERAYVQGTQLDIAIPFEGDPMLWRISASTFSLSGYPEIEVQNDRIVFNVSFPDDTANPEKIRAQVDRNIKSLADAVRNLKRDVDNHNQNARGKITYEINRKKELAQSTVGAVVALGIPMKRRDQPLTFTAPTKRRELPTTRPKVSTEPYKPEPVLAEAEYDHILEIMRSMSLVIERNPDAFTSLDEEAIRTHFLLQLNGHYEGSASGETFNASGKTDILIRVENRNIFIAECKFWRGQKGFTDAVDQLLGYLSWRDTKSALLIFNRTKDSSAVRQKMHEAMQGRPEHKKTVFFDPHGDSKYILVKESDPGREIVVTTQLYDMPSLKK